MKRSILFIVYASVFVCYMHPFSPIHPWSMINILVKTAGEKRSDIRIVVTPLVSSNSSFKLAFIKMNKIYVIQTKPTRGLC